MQYSFDGEYCEMAGGDIYICVLVLRAGQLGALVKYASRLEGNKQVSKNPAVVAWR